jgi:tetratricopeptide (TPR) repeat protein
MSKQSRARATPKPTNSAALSPAPSTFLFRWGNLLAGAMVVAAALMAYHNSFSGPFLLDDQFAITSNPTIKHLGSAWLPPADLPVGGRPVLNLTFALNYALGGLNARGYHVFNLLIHILAGLTLFGVVRRTLLEHPTSNVQHPTPKANHSLDAASTPRTISRNPRLADATPLALAVAVLWVVHPIQTEAVTYISQRAESLMGLFYLLTLYCFIRGADARHQTSGFRFQEKKSESVSPISRIHSGLPDARRLTPDAWLVASILSCLLGSMCKETMVTAPVMILLYDRTFAAGCFREAWRLRRWYYLGLAATWLLLACLMMGLGQRGVGFDQKVTGWHYALTSCRSVVLYLKLAVWPHPLIFDHGTHIIRHVAEIMPDALVLTVLLAAVLVALRYRPVVGFAGAWFFIILAPTSSVVPVAFQPMAEHRVYLSLAAVVVLGVLGLYRLIGRRSLILFAAAAIGLGWLSVQRNKDYTSELGIWRDTVAKCPDNERAHNTLGKILLYMPGRLSDAIAQFQATILLKPDSMEAHYNLGLALAQIPGCLPDAATQYRTALWINPDSVETRVNLGSVLLNLPGRLPDAILQFEAALRINPDSVEARDNLGNALASVPGRLPDALAQFEAALRINPGLAETHYNYGNALRKIPGRLPDAMAQYEAALRINPNHAQAHNNLGNILSQLPGRLPDALAEYEAALRINPDYAEAQGNRALMLSQLPGRLPDALAQYEVALRTNPDSADAHYNFGNALAQSGRFIEALGEYKIAIQLKPDFAPAHNNLGNALLQLGRLPEAIKQYELALKLNPDGADVRSNLEQARKQMAKH